MGERPVLQEDSIDLAMNRALAALAVVLLNMMGETSLPHVHFDFDDERPAIGVIYYFAWDPAKDERHLRLLKSSVDYVHIGMASTRDVKPDGTIDVTQNRCPPYWHPSPQWNWNASYAVRLVEEVGIPWVGGVQGLLEWGPPPWFPEAFPDEIEIGPAGYRPKNNVTSISRFAENAWAIQEGAIRAAITAFSDSPHLVGWNSGSEPDVFGWWDENNPHGTGFSDLTMREFRLWLAELFADEAPNMDANGDGVTLNWRCKTEFSSWDEVSATALVEHVELRSFHDRFLAKLTNDYVARTVEIFRQLDDEHLTVTRLLPPIYRSQRLYHSLSLLGIGDTLGFTGCPVRKSVDDPRRHGFDVSLVRRVDIAGTEHRAFLLHPPFPRPGTSFIIFQVDIPAAEEPMLRFFTGQAAPPGNRSDGIVFRVFVGTQKIFEYFHKDSGWQEHSVGLAPWQGQSVSLRFETDPGPARHFGSDWANWGEIHIQDTTRRHDLLALFNEAHVGRKLDDGSVKLIDTPKLVFDPHLNDFWFAVMAGHAKKTGKRIAPVETHPTVAVKSYSLWSLLHEVFRSLPFKPAEFTFFCYRANQQYAYENHDLAPYVKDLRRLRCLLALLNPYNQIQRQPRFALFLPDFLSRTKVPGKDPRGGNPSLRKMVSEIGMNVHPLNDIDLAPGYEGVVIVLGTHDRPIGEAVAQFLEGGYPGRILVLQCETPLRGMPSVSPKLLEFVRNARKSWLKGRVRSGDKRWDAYTQGNTRYVQALPPDGMDAIARAWLKEHDRNQSFGALHILRRSAQIGEEGLFLLEGCQGCSLKEGFVAYDLVRARPVQELDGPGLFRVFQAIGPRLVDSGLARIVQRTPASIGELRDPRTVVPTSDAWQVRIEAFDSEPDENWVVVHSEVPPAALMEGVPVEVARVAQDFYRISVPQSGILSIEFCAIQVTAPPTEQAGD